MRRRQDAALKRRMSLRVQLMLYFLSVSVVVMTVGSYIIYRNMTDVLRQRNEELVLQQFEQVHQNLSSLYTELGRIAGLLLADDSVQTYIQTGAYTATYDNVQIVNDIYEEARDILQSLQFIDSIYLFTQDREGLGVSRSRHTLIIKRADAHPFFDTGVFDEMLAAPSRRAWRNDHTRAFFNGALAQLPDGDTPVISYMEAVNSFMNPSRRAVLVFNISERHLALLYGALEDADGVEPYIVDQDGWIVSAMDVGRIRTRSQTLADVDLTDRYGSVTLPGEDAPVQIIHYDMPDLGWRLVKEMPLGTDAAYAFYAQRNFVVIIAGISVLVIIFISFFWLRRITRPLHELAVGMADVGRGNIGVDVGRVPRNEIGTVITRFNEMSRSIAELLRLNERMEAEKRGHEFAALQAQINPHFLYNTLNTIKWMAAAAGANDVVESLVALGNILRPVFQSSETTWTLRQEASYLENYARIMNWRYSGAVRFTVEIKEACLLEEVPRFMLQPLVENAILHGLSHREGEAGLDVRVSAAIGDARMTVEVRDTGRGMDAQTLNALRSAIAAAWREDPDALPSDTGRVGIRNIARRVRITYGAGAGIRIDSPPEGGTRVCMDLPLRARPFIESDGESS